MIWKSDGEIVAASHLMTDISQFLFDLLAISCQADDIGFPTFASATPPGPGSLAYLKSSPYIIAVDSLHAIGYPTAGKSNPNNIKSKIFNTKSSDKKIPVQKWQLARMQRKLLSISIHPCANHPFWYMRRTLYIIHFAFSTQIKSNKTSTKAAAHRLHTTSKRSMAHRA